MIETAQRKAAIYGAILAGVLVAMFILVSALLAMQMEEHKQSSALAKASVEVATANHQKELAVKQRDAEIDQLKSLVQKQTAQIHTLSSRSSSGPMSVQATPWAPYEATWYSYEGGVGRGTITATGSHVENNWTVAVDPRVIPLGSIVEVKFQDGTDKIYKAVDTGGAIHGNRIDIFSSSEADCQKHGRQMVEVRVLVRG